MGVQLPLREHGAEKPEADGQVDPRRRSRATPNERQARQSGLSIVAAGGRPNALDARDGRSDGAPCCRCLDRDSDSGVRSLSPHAADPVPARRLPAGFTVDLSSSSAHVVPRSRPCRRRFDSVGGPAYGVASRHFGEVFQLDRGRRLPDRRRCPERVSALSTSNYGASDACGRGGEVRRVALLTLSVPLLIRSPQKTSTSCSEASSPGTWRRRSPRRSDLRRGHPRGIARRPAPPCLPRPSQLRRAVGRRRSICLVALPSGRSCARRHFSSA